MNESEKEGKKVKFASVNPVEYQFVKKKENKKVKSEKNNQTLCEEGPPLPFSKTVLILLHHRWSPSGEHASTVVSASFVSLLALHSLNTLAPQLASLM